MAKIAWLVILSLSAKIAWLVILSLTPPCEINCDNLAEAKLLVW